MASGCVLVWMRGALRIADNGLLWHAHRDAADVLPFICTGDGWDEPDGTPRRRFMRGAIAELHGGLRRRGSALFVLEGDPLRAIPRAAAALSADALYVAVDHDPAIRRGHARLARALAGIGCAFRQIDDSVLFGKDDILTASGTPYRVFTPYKKAWRARMSEAPPPYPVAIRSLSAPPNLGMVSSLSGFAGASRGAGESSALRLLREFTRYRIGFYGRLRDIPGEDGTSRLSGHIANGTLSVRTVLRASGEALRLVGEPGRNGVELFVGELIWREFFHQILGNFRSVAEGPFREEFRGVHWSRSRTTFGAWCEGRTGYPIVDAGMRQLNAEGWMHNRVRMIAASFLTKDLHINWEWGERYFFRKLIDADLASNNGNWQWCAGTGTDASPWFRIFNPVLQGKRFDPAGVFIRRYVPELARVPAAHIHAPWEMSPAAARGCSFRIGRDYPLPVVDHERERQAALAMYRTIRQGKRK